MLDNIIGVTEASEITGLAEGTVKNYCASGKFVAKKIGKTWVLDKTKLKEMEEMEIIENIKRIIEEIENGTIELENLDPNFHEMEYVDGPKGIWIVHEVEGQEGLEVFFAEREEFEDARQRVYEGEDEAIFEDLVNNEYSDQFNYDEVVAYRYDGGEINWI